MKNDKMAVKFVKAHGSYVKGDIAGFDAVKAQQLKDAGKAVGYSPAVADIKISVDATGAAAEIERMVGEATVKIKEREAAVENSVREIETQSARLTSQAQALATKEAKLEAREAALNLQAASVDDAANVDGKKSDEKILGDTGKPPKTKGATSATK